MPLLSWILEQDLFPQSVLDFGAGPFGPKSRTEPPAVHHYPTSFLSKHDGTIFPNDQTGIYPSKTKRHVLAANPNKIKHHPSTSFFTKHDGTMRFTCGTIHHRQEKQ